MLHTISDDIVMCPQPHTLRFDHLRLCRLQQGQHCAYVADGHSDMMHISTGRSRLKEGGEQSGAMV